MYVYHFTVEYIIFQRFFMTAICALAPILNVVNFVVVVKVIKILDIIVVHANA